MIGDETRRAAGDAIICRQLDWVAVFGRTEGMAVHELLAMAEGADLAAFAWVKDYEAGIAAYGRRDFDGALKLFEAVNAARPGGDAPSRIFIERCRELIATPPGPDWSPIAVQMEK